LPEEIRQAVDVDEDWHGKPILDSVGARFTGLVSGPISKIEISVVDADSDAEGDECLML
jgi:hypothetical protein